MKPGQWHQVRLLRQAERLWLFVDGVEHFSERIPDVELPRLLLQGSYGDVGDEIEFRDLEIRAPTNGLPAERGLR
jgi:hypothetical protein